MMVFNALARKRQWMTATLAVPPAIALGAIGAIGAIAALAALLAWCFTGYLRPAFLVRLIYASSFCG
jgi:hypothetical protein